MLNLDKCQLGLIEKKWFGMIYLKEAMSKDPEKMDQILKFKPPENKNGVQSFLLTIQFCSFLKLKNGKTDAVYQ